MSRSLMRGMRRLIGTSKLIALRAPANSAIGDRRSTAIGPGIEFAQYKDYEPGDDLRHLDRHVYSRFGRTAVRQYHLEQRLRVYVLLDASGSMGVDSTSWQRAVELAVAFGLAALNGSDQVRIGVASGKRVDWGPSITREAELWREVGRLSQTQPTGGVGSFTDFASRSLEVLSRAGILVVVSDWLVDGYELALKSWHVRGHEVIAIQVLGEAEAGPQDGPTGWLRLVDAESGETMERRADAATWRTYRATVASWSEKVRDAVWAVEGRWLTVVSGREVDEATVRSMRGHGLIT